MYVFGRRGSLLPAIDRKRATLPETSRLLLAKLWLNRIKLIILLAVTRSIHIVCSAGLETVDNVVAGCGAMAPTDYTDRHNQVASIIHWNIYRHFQVPVERRWYRHQPDRLVETDDILVMCDTTIPTAGKIKANRPDI